MRRLCFLLALLSPAVVWADGVLRGFAPHAGIEAVRRFRALILGSWPEDGPSFVASLAELREYYALIPLGIVLLLFGHYFIFGPRRFAHTGRRVPYYSGLVRFVHWGAALFMSLVVLSGLGIVFARVLGGGALVMGLRVVHTGAAYASLGFGSLLFFLLVRDMGPASCDLRWLAVGGGYLSRQVEPVPAGKFNAGQKLWFWVASLGGAFLFWTGYRLHTFAAPGAELREALLLHYYAGLPLLGLFLVHLYMSLLAVPGSLASMIRGDKDEAEVRLLHPEFYAKIKG